MFGRQVGPLKGQEDRILQGAEMARTDRYFCNNQTQGQEIKKQPCLRNALARVWGQGRFVQFLQDERTIGIPSPVSWFCESLLCLSVVIVFEIGSRYTALAVARTELAF